METLVQKVAQTKSMVENVRALNRELGKARERELWSAFGTIGFDAYVSWVMSGDAFYTSNEA